MSFLTRLADRLFAPVTIEQVIAQDLEESQKQIRRCEAVIRDHRFLKHMALRKIEALEEWHKLNPSVQEST